MREVIPKLSAIISEVLFHVFCLRFAKIDERGGGGRKGASEKER